MHLRIFFGLCVSALCVVTPVTAHAQDGGRPAYRSAAAQPDPVEVPVDQLCMRARSGETEAINQLAWAFTYGKGTERNDAYASYLFYAAATAGHEGAKRMLRSMSWPAAEVPPCLTEVPPPVATSARFEPPPHTDQLVRSLAPKYELDPLLVLAVIEVESNFNPSALSPKNAMGLMQLIPETAQRFGVRKPFDARENVQGGMSYLRWLLAYFEGDLSLVTAAYNAGEGAVDKYRGVPPYAETQEYVRKVLGRFGAVRHPFDAKVVPPSLAVKASDSKPSPPKATAVSSERRPAKRAGTRRASDGSLTAASQAGAAPRVGKLADAQAVR